MQVERSKPSEVIQNSLFGVSRGVLVRVVIQPFDVVRTLQQSKNEGSCYKIAATLYQENGARAFFAGLSPNLLRTAMKQGWVWPVLIQMPALISLENPLAQQAVTGMVIAGIDATFIPLERAKIALIQKKKWSWKEGWNGYCTHLSKLSSCWMTFLVGQKYFRDRNIEPGKKASLSQLLDISFKTTLLVSAISAPFDIANTQKIANNVNFRTFYTNNKMRKMFRGCPLHFTSLFIQNIASILLIDQFDKR